MTLVFRVIDTGVREGRMQIAFDEALITLHKCSKVPDTVRFLRFPPTALIGRHQAVSHELKLDHIRRNGIGIARRITGGGAIYLDEGQIGWEIVLSRKRLRLSTLGDYTTAICEAVADGLSRSFDIDARFRPRNDIEVGGRKICGTGGYFDGDTLIYQGTVLRDVDPGAMMACLNVPSSKLAKRELDKAEARITTLRDIIGRTPDVEDVHAAILTGLASRFDLTFERALPTAEEEALARSTHDEEIGTDEFVYSVDEPRAESVLEGMATAPGGTVIAFVRLEGSGGARRLREVLITGDFFISPPRAIHDLEAHLRGVPVDDVGSSVDWFFENRKTQLCSVEPAAFRNAIEAALVASP